MTDVRTLVTEAMREHWLTTETPDSLADVLFSLAGIAIVGLPEPDGLRWFVDQDDDDFHVGTMDLVSIKAGSVERGCRVSWGEIDLGLTIPIARALAAALLAAANVAEVDNA